MSDPHGRSSVPRRLRLLAAVAAVAAASQLPRPLSFLPGVSHCRAETPDGIQRAVATTEPSPVAGDREEPKPSTRPADPKAVAAAIRDLGSDDFDTREKAARFLFSLGDAAVPALRQAAEGDDPEAAGRARTLLDNMASGLRPDSPGPVADLLAQFRAGREPEKREAAEALAKLGPPGVRVLMELARIEPDEGLRRILVSDLGAVSRPTAAALIASGLEDDLALAGRLLGTAAGTNEAAARDDAAFRVLRGTGDEAVRRLSADLTAAEAADREAARRAAVAGPPVPGAPVGAPPAGQAAGAGGDNAGAPAMRLAYLYRAAGDPAAALAAARKAGGFGAPAGAAVPGGDGSQSTSLVESLLTAAGEWKAAAAELEQRGNPDGSVESLGYLAAYYRLAGDAAAADRWANRLVEFARQNPNVTHEAATALFLNDRAADGIDLLRKHGDYAEAAEYLGPQLRFPEVLAMLEQARAGGATGLAALRARSAEALHFEGREKEAAAALASVADGEEGAPDFDAWLAVVAAARETGQPAERLDDWCVRAMASYKPKDAGEAANDPRPRLLEKAGFQRPDQALKWWPILRARHADDDAAATFRQLRRLDEGRWPDADLDLFAGEMQAEAGKLPDAGRDERLMLVGDALVAAGRTEAAARLYDHLARVSTDPAALRAAGDFEAGRKHWEQAAARYGRACADDPARPTMQYLWGWALEQAGVEAAREPAGRDKGEALRKEGRARRDRADLMALGDESARHALADAMAKHGLTDEAKRERDLMVRTAEFGSWQLVDALRQAGDAANAAGDYPAAAGYWDRSFLHNLSTRVYFAEPSANLLIPALVHHTRARGLFRAGRLAEGMKEAELSFTLCPGDADGQIDLVNELQDHGHGPEADAVYRRPLGLYAKLLHDYPDSAPANNLVAWFQGRCHRDLDQALVYAKKAVALAPASTGILDTLAEVHFQRGEYDRAIELIRKCIDVEPAVKHHRENLERFTAAKQKAATQPGTVPK